MNTLLSDNLDLKLAVNLTTLVDEIFVQFDEFLEKLKSQTLADWREKCHCGFISKNNDEISEIVVWETVKSDFAYRLNEMKNQLNDRIDVANCDHLNKESNFAYASEKLVHHDEESNSINVEQFLKTTFSIGENPLVPNSLRVESTKPKPQSRKRKKFAKSNQNDKCEFCLHRYIKLAIPNPKKLNPQECICSPEVRCERYGCNYLARCQHELEMHLFCQHEEGTICGIDGCNYTSQSRYRMAIHKRKHTGEKPYKCDQCDYSASSVQCMRHHKLIHSNRILECDIDGCKYQTPNPILFERHKKTTHDTSGNFKCPWQECKYNSPIKMYVDQHYRLHTGEKPFACTYPDCDQRFPMKSYLKAHIRKYHENLPPVNRFTCTWPGCTFATCSRTGLEQHMNKHLGRRPYKCDWPGCDGAFARDSALRTHKKTHTGERPYACSWPSCDKRFALKQKLEDHMRIHTGYKPYQCPHPGCTYRASLSGNVNKHFNKRHKKPY